MIKRRSFLQLLTLPALAALWPRAVTAQASDPPWYSDDAGAIDPVSLRDSNLATGIEYLP